MCLQASERLSPAVVSHIVKRSMTREALPVFGRGSDGKIIMPFSTFADKFSSAMAGELFLPHRLMVHFQLIL